VACNSHGRVFTGPIRPDGIRDIGYSLLKHYDNCLDLGAMEAGGTMPVKEVLIVSIDYVTTVFLMGLTHLYRHKITGIASTPGITGIASTPGITASNLLLYEVFHSKRMVPEVWRSFHLTIRLSVVLVGACAADSQRQG
jgi:hypothetical protein